MVVVEVLALWAERSMALEMLGTSALGSDGVVGFLGSQLDFDSLETAVLVRGLTEIETAGWVAGGVLDFSFTLL